MIKRISLVWKRQDLDPDAFRSVWLGEHADLARQLPRIREYVIDVNESPRDGEPDGVATLRFDTREDCDAAFADPEIAPALFRTRDEFARRVEVFFVQENVVFRDRTV